MSRQVAGGDLANAGYTYHAGLLYLVDCAPSIESWVAEVEAGLAFLPRTGSECGVPGGAAVRGAGRGPRLRAGNV